MEKHLPFDEEKWHIYPLHATEPVAAVEDVS